MTDTRVLIVGAGPTGLVLALWLTAQGVDVRIVDRSSGPGTTSRAMAVHARTLELYRQLDLAEAVIEDGHRNPAANLWFRGERKARVSFGSAGAKRTPFPFVLVYPQDRHEQLLENRLRALGVKVERETELVDFEDRDDRVRARLRTRRGGREECETLWVAGCDGAHSIVRRQLGVGFGGGTYNHVFYVADIEASGPQPTGEVHISIEHSDFVALLAYGTEGRSRLIGIVRNDRLDEPNALSFEDVGRRAIEALGMRIDKVNWFSTYRVHHRVADEFRRGRAFLLGDSGHLHSPAGGQGMNTGIGDAINLAWKLAAVLKGEAREVLLDSYEPERIAFARTLVDTTDRFFRFVTADGRFADLVRTRVAPTVAALAYRTSAVRELLFRVLSQTMLSYRESALSRGKAGKVSGGDRLPWVGWTGADNYAPLAAIAWQLHVYGAASTELRRCCERRRLALHVFDWRPEFEKAGLARDAVYVLRPDTYVGLADPHPSRSSLSRYFAEIGYDQSVSAPA